MNSTDRLNSQNAPFDVLVIGSGAAGLYASLCLSPHLKVGLLTKGDLQHGSSCWAQGGVAAAIAPGDSPQLHLQDTLRAGAGLCDIDAVEFMVEHAPAAIESLVALGVNFDRLGSNLAMTLEAAHSRPRVLHAADTTGQTIVETLTAQVAKRANIEIFARSLAIGLWKHPQGHCQGVSVLHQGRVQWLAAGAVILATGGGGQVFARTTNPEVSTGDGVALAWRSRAVLRDLEFFQFHPTALTLPGVPRFLISEAVRGEGAHLVDETGSRFAFNYHPDGELAPRDVVSRAIYQHLEATTGNPTEGHVYLDLSPIPREQIRRRFPKIAKVCQQYGIDIFQDPIPVAPAAHYWMGGVSVDLENQTSIPGLFAIGETASTGIHGANRLASNSLLECIVFAAQFAHFQPTLPVESPPQEQAIASIVADSADIELVKTIRQQLPSLMWQHAGVYRHASGLETATTQVNRWRSQLAQTRLGDFLLHLPPHEVVLESAETAAHLQVTVETQNLLDIADLILGGAAFRTESRGGHHRIDYPHSNPEWEVHTLVEGDRRFREDKTPQGRLAS